MIKYTNHDNISLSLAVWLSSNFYDYDNTPNTISATTLLNPIRAIILGLQNKDLQKIGDISMNIPSSMGTAYHDSIEKSWTSDKLKETLESLGYSAGIADRIKVNPTKKELVEGTIPVYMEQRSKKQLKGYIVSGKFDFVAEGTLEDFKSTSVYAHIFGSNNEKYMQQGSIYRWLNPEIITEDYMRIQYIFTDWKSSDAKRDGKYPQSRLLTKKIKLMSIAETEIFVGNIIDNIKSNLSNTQDQLPLCTPTELWQKDDVWKYYKDPSKLKRSTKNFDNALEANTRRVKDGNVGKIVHISGEVVKCKYCNVVDICTQAQDLIHQKLLII